MEFSGDSQVVVNWLLGLYATSNHVYTENVAKACNQVYALCSSLFILPPSAGHDIWKWVYREGNCRADEMTWAARRGIQERKFDSALISDIKNGYLQVSGIRGAFDGGCSESGVGCGWICDVYLTSISKASFLGPSYCDAWYHNACYESLLLPASTTITEAELTAATRLLQGVVLFLCEAGLCHSQG